ncbi:hypothetical protein [Undibacterium luofuense]|uniref:hypothetical protein n=1 Tax=Undibacterium luofuense TaxID=2828733 RepID=UPI0030EBF825
MQTRQSMTELSQEQLNLIAGGAKENKTGGGCTDVPVFPFSKNTLTSVMAEISDQSQSQR